MTTPEQSAADLTAQIKQNFLARARRTLNGAMEEAGDLKATISDPELSGYADEIIRCVDAVNISIERADIDALFFNMMAFSLAVRNCNLRLVRLKHPKLRNWDKISKEFAASNNERAGKREDWQQEAVTDYQQLRIKYPKLSKSQLIEKMCKSDPWDKRGNPQKDAQGNQLARPIAASTLYSYLQQVE